MEVNTSASWSAQSVNTLPGILSEPAAFLMKPDEPSNALLSFSMVKKNVRANMGRSVGGWSDVDSKCAKKLLSSSAKLLLVLEPGS